MLSLEFRESSTGSIDPWSMERITKPIIVTDDMAIWVRVGGRHVFKVLPDTQTRIEKGEDPEKVLMDALETLRPGMFRRMTLFGKTIELGRGEIDPKKRWSLLVSGQSFLTTNGRPGQVWVYYENCPPFPIHDYLGFSKDLEAVENEEELEMLIDIWNWK